MVLGPLAFLYHIYRDYRNDKTKLAEEQTKNLIKDDLQIMAEKAKVASEEVRDFNDAVSKFNGDNNGKS